MLRTNPPKWPPVCDNYNLYLAMLRDETSKIIIIQVHHFIRKLRESFLSRESETEFKKLHDLISLPPFPTLVLHAATDL